MSEGRVRGPKGADGDPVRTPDADLAVGSKVPILSKPIDELLMEAGFKKEYHGAESPPVTHLVLKNAPRLEFITPHNRMESSTAVAGMRKDPEFTQWPVVSALSLGPEA
jgi:hypothetical protein